MKLFPYVTASWWNYGSVLGLYVSQWELQIGNMTSPRYQSSPWYGLVEIFYNSVISETADGDRAALVVQRDHKALLHRITWLHITQNVL